MPSNMSAYFFIIIMLVVLVCVVLHDAKVKLAERYRKTAKLIIIAVVCGIGVMAVFRTEHLLENHAMFPDIYQPYYMNYYPIALWVLVSIMMYGVYRRMSSC